MGLRKLVLRGLLISCSGLLCGADGSKIGKTHCDMTAILSDMYEFKSYTQQHLLPQLTLVKTAGEMTFYRDGKHLASISIIPLYKKNWQESRRFKLDYHYEPAQGKDGFLAVVELIRQFTKSEDNIVSSFKIQRRDYGGDGGFSPHGIPERLWINFLHPKYTYRERVETVSEGAQRSQILYDLYTFKNSSRTRTAK